MPLARAALLWISENQTLRQTLPKVGFVRKAVKRFMPGEELEDALAAAEILQAKELPAILTRLGENILDLTEAERVTSHYLNVLEQVHRRKLDCYVSVKLTQMGFDIDKEQCYLLFRQLTAKAREFGNLVWIDMEQSTYVDDTLAFYERARREFDNVGVCLQSYLYRTDTDLQRLISLHARIRLVKGAYKEPANIAYPKKLDVDESFFRQTCLLLQHTRATGTVHGIGTHDIKLINRIIDEAKREKMSPDQYEFQMLYGIKAWDQERLRQEGHRVRVLISYGSYWFPWYMRRLAERPANVWFVVKNVFGG
jgi:proline dehydrogenase